MLLPAALAAAIASLALAAPVSAADPVAGVLDTVTKAATPAVAPVVSAPAPVAPTPAAAQQAGDVAPKPVPVERAVEHATGSLTTGTAASGAGSQISAASTHHDLTPAGAAPGHQPASASRSAEGSHALEATPSRDLGSGTIAGATRSIVSSTGRLPVPAGAVVHDIGLAAGEVTSGVSHATGLPSADRVLPPSVLPGVAARVVESAPARISTLLATLPSLPTAPAITGPPESERSPTPGFSTAPSPAPSPPPVALSLPAAGAGGGGATPSPVTALQGAWLASSVVQAYVATANGIGGVIGAPGRPASRTSSAGGVLRGAASQVSWAAGTTASAYGLSTSDGTARAAPDTASSGRAYEQPSPAPSPGSAAPATGAVAGTSIPIFLTLAGLILLAAPRARRVLRLLGETWRLSPLALILERPG